jgi:cytochrome c-type biogenesis protein CcmH
VKRAALLALLCIAASFAARAIDPARLEDPVQQQRYEDLIHELKCLQCTGENIADTPAQFAVDIRRQVREMIQSGSSDAEVRQYLVDRYGEIILLSPRTAWLWLVPGLLLILGAVVAIRIVRQRRELLATDTSEPGDEERA